MRTRVRPTKPSEARGGAGSYEFHLCVSKGKPISRGSTREHARVWPLPPAQLAGRLRETSRQFPLESDAHTGPSRPGVHRAHTQLAVMKEDGAHWRGGGVLACPRVKRAAGWIEPVRVRVTCSTIEVYMIISRACGNRRSFALKLASLRALQLELCGRI